MRVGASHAEGHRRKIWGYVCVMDAWFMGWISLRRARGKQVV